MNLKNIISLLGVVGLSAGALGLSTSRSSASPSSVLLGNSTIQPVSDGSSYPSSEAFGFTAASSGLASSISVYLTTTDGVKLAIYNNNNNRPGSQIVSGKVSNNTVGWTTVSIPSTNIISGNLYWIVVGANKNGHIVYQDAGGNGSNLDYSSNKFGSPYVPNGQWNSNPISAYVSGQSNETTTTSSTTTTSTTTTTTTIPTTTTTVTGTACVRTGSGSSELTNDNCGPYSDPNIAWSNGSNVYAGPDGWACGTNSCPNTTFTAYSAENFSVTTTAAAGNTGVLMFPSGCLCTTPDPVLSTLHSLTSNYSETMPINNGTTGWSAYDIFMNSGQEVMIQTEQEHACVSCSTTIGSTTISGIPFTVVQYGGAGGEIIFTPNTTPSGSTTGTMDLLAAFNWLISHGYLQSTDSLGLVSFGHEVCSTGGVPETWTVSQFTLNES